MKAAAPLRAISRSFWGRLALHALWLHGLWEVAQCSAFYDMSGVSPLSGSVFMVGATLADLVLTLLLVFLALRLSAASAEFLTLRAFLWLVGLGAVAAIAIEIFAQTGGWWRYSPAMPTISVFGTLIGAWPLLQMAILPPICLFLASREPHSR